jgi:4-diphosphocytidyl-2-C-methyl-D-erythritol kinase
VIVHACAKVNLSLEVDAARGDGYHPYRSWATSVSLADTLDVRRSEQPGVRVTTDTGVVDTLATAAATAVLRHAGLDGTVGLEIAVTKRIPAGAGLGGGSADAAAAITAAARVVAEAGGDVPDVATLAAIATAVGTDVPFCLVGGLAALTGRGEVVRPVGALPAVGLLVAVPDVHLSTAEVFATFDRVGPATEAPTVPDWLTRLLPDCSFRNDLEPAALSLAPELGAAKAVIEECAGAAAVMTGSGSGYVVAAESAAALVPVVERLAARGIRAWACTPTPYGVAFDHSANSVGPSAGGGR